MSWAIDTAFPGANACAAAVDVVDGLPAVSLTPDPGDAPEALWFRLRLRRLDADAPAPWLVLRHCATLLGGGDPAALQPVVRRDHGGWERLARGVRRERADGQVDGLWRLPAAAAVMEVAFCVPYDHEDLDRRVAASRLRVSAVGASERGRPLLRVDNGAGAIGSTRPGLFVLARQHSGETPGSWVLDGLLARIAELGDAAPLTWAIPFADLDGVVEGRYGKDRHPVDHNRAWPGDDSQPRRHEVLCGRQEIARWRARCVPALLLDLHAPGAGERTGVYAFTAIGAEGAVPPVVSAWAERLRAGLGEPWAAAKDFARIGRYPGRWPRETHLNVARWALREGLPALSLETSYQGQGDRAFGVDDYRAIGGRLADLIAAAGILEASAGVGQASR